MQWTFWLFTKYVLFPFTHIFQLWYYYRQHAAKPKLLAFMRIKVAWAENRTMSWRHSGAARFGVVCMWEIRWREVLLPRVPGAALLHATLKFYWMQSRRRRGNFYPPVLLKSYLLPHFPVCTSNGNLQLNKLKEEVIKLFSSSRPSLSFANLADILAWWQNLE